MSFFFFFKQKTAYEMRISDWSSDVCSSDLDGDADRPSPASRDGETGSQQRFATSPPRRHGSVCPGACKRGKGRRARSCERQDRARCRLRTAAATPWRTDDRDWTELGREHVCTHVNNAHLACRHEPNNKTKQITR